MDYECLDEICKNRGYHLCDENRWCKTCKKFIIIIRNVNLDENEILRKDEVIMDDEDNENYDPDGCDVFDFGEIEEECNEDDDDDDNDEDHYVCYNDGKHAYALKGDKWICMYCGKGLYKY